MQDDLSVTFANASHSSVCVVDGHGIAIRVQRGQLHITDGLGRNRRQRSYWRGNPGIDRLLLLSGDGYVSVGALRWLVEVGIGLIQLDGDARLITTTAETRLNDARLRRNQALASKSTTGLEVARRLLSLKIDGQSRLLDQLSASRGIRQEMDRTTRAIEEVSDIEQLRHAEARAAAAYWQAWTSIRMRFRSSDAKRVPEYWLRFHQRGSPITSSPRLAANPVNALLNYLYALLEGETRIACFKVGLDPGMGIVHADQGARDSLVLDIMEAVRPQVDRYVLELLESRTFRARDFHETRTGNCRILPPLTHLLAETTTAWANRIAPIAESIAALLRHGSEGDAMQMSTPLTEMNRSIGRGSASRRLRSPMKPVYPATCRDCGELTDDGSRLCPACLADARADRGSPQVNRRAHHSDDASIRRGNAISSRWDELKTWSLANPDPPDRSIFRNEIWPMIKHRPITTIVNATGLSQRYAQLIRQGKVVPHARHWDKLRSL